MDGTGDLLAPAVEALSPSLQPRVVCYPPDEELGYSDLLEQAALPEVPHLLVAESFSGPLAVKLASQNPAQLRGLVLVASFVRCPSTLLRFGRGLCRPRLFRRLPPRWMLRRYFLGDDASEPDLDELSAAVRQVSAEVMARRIREMAEVDVRDELTRVRVPILYLGATRDRLVGRAMAQEILRLAPHAEAVWLDAPHLVMQRRPKECAEAIARFAQRL
jgi:pimeloyl-ACP methyl ester carboxylesterase